LQQADDEIPVDSDLVHRATQHFAIFSFIKENQQFSSRISFVLETLRTTDKQITPISAMDQPTAASINHLDDFLSDAGAQPGLLAQPAAAAVR
jgi:hypothetical protein